MPAARRHTTQLSFSLVDLFGGAEKREAPGEFRLLRMGVNPSEKGDFLFDDQAAASVMEHFRQQGRDLVIDYEHMSLAQPPQKSPAAGWFRLELRADGLYAVNVKWTDEAKAELEAGQYRYFSPAFNHDPKTGRVLSIINNALTNNPALHSIPALVAASARHSEDTTMDEELKKLQARIIDLEKTVGERDGEIAKLRGQGDVVALSVAVGLGASAAPAEIRSTVTALANFRREVLSITGKDTEATALGALSAMKEQAAEVVALRAKVGETEVAALTAEFNAYLDGLATKGEDGKFLPPAAREKAVALAIRIGGGKLTKDGVAAAKEYIPAMLTSVPSTGATAKPNNLALTDVQKQVNKLMGIKNDAFIKDQEKRLAGE